MPTSLKFPRGWPELSESRTQEPVAGSVGEGGWGERSAGSQLDCQNLWFPETEEVYGQIPETPD